MATKKKTPTYKKKMNNGYEYYYYKIYNPRTKKQKEVQAKTLKELKEKIEIENEKIKKGITDDHILFGDFLETWLFSVHLIDKKPSTKERYDSIFRNYLKYSDFSKVKLSRLTAVDIQEYYNKVFEEKASSSIIKSMHKIISPCLRYAAITGRILRDFSEAIKIPKDDVTTQLERIQNSNIRPLTLNEQFHFFNTIKGHELEALFLTAIDTGIRQGELFALTWRDINFSDETIDIHKTFKIVKNIKTNLREATTGPPKTLSSIRILPIPQNLVGVLKMYKEKQNGELREAGIHQNENSLVFSTKIGTHLDSQNVRKRIQAIYEKINITDKCFHDLRHTYATRLFEMGEDPKVVQTLLGHGSLATTLNTYIHILEKLKQKSADKIASIYTDQRRNALKSNKKIEKNTYCTCLPLTSRNEDELFSDLLLITHQQYNFIEWRRDYYLNGCFTNAEDEKSVIEKLKENLDGTGLIYTYRKYNEGGSNAIPDDQRLKGIIQSIQMAVDYVDVELNNDISFLKAIKEEISKNNHTKLILSFHDFEKTPSEAQLDLLLEKMIQLDADVFKISVMPLHENDVRTLIKFSINNVNKTLKPFIFVSMGIQGSVTRVIPELIGSSLSYISEKEKTAPGQLSHNEIKNIRNLLGFK